MKDHVLFMNTNFHLSSAQKKMSFMIVFFLYDDDNQQQFNLASGMLLTLPVNKNIVTSRKKQQHFQKLIKSKLIWSLFLVLFHISFSLFSCLCVFMTYAVMTLHQVSKQQQPARFSSPFFLHFFLIFQQIFYYIIYCLAFYHHHELYLTLIPGSPLKTHKHKRKRRKYRTPSL